MEIKVVKSITVPVLKLEAGKPIYVHVLEALREGQSITTEGEIRRKPAKVLRVLQLSDGQEYDVVCPIVLVGVLETEMLNDYVGKDLEVHKHEPVEGKSYSKFTIREIEPVFDTEAGEFDPRPVARKGKKA